MAYLLADITMIALQHIYKCLFYSAQMVFGMRWLLQWNNKYKKNYWNQFGRVHSRFSFRFLFLFYNTVMFSIPHRFSAWSYTNWCTSLVKKFMKYLGLEENEKFQPCCLLLLWQYSSDDLFYTYLNTQLQFVSNYCMQQIKNLQSKI